jgi:hypothetical protein
MDEPIRSIVRAARPGGLTSPEPVTALARPSGHRQPAVSGTRTSRRTVSGKTAMPGRAKITACKVITRETIT